MRTLVVILSTVLLLGCDMESDVVNEIHTSQEEILDQCMNLELYCVRMGDAMICNRIEDEDESNHSGQ